MRIRILTGKKPLPLRIKLVRTVEEIVKYGEVKILKSSEYQKGEIDTNFIDKSR